MTPRQLEILRVVLSYAQSSVDDINEAFAEIYEEEGTEPLVASEIEAFRNEVQG